MIALSPLPRKTFAARTDATRPRLLAFYPGRPVPRAVWHGRRAFSLIIATPDPAECLLQLERPGPLWVSTHAAALDTLSSLWTSHEPAAALRARIEAATWIVETDSPLLIPAWLRQASLRIHVTPSRGEEGEALGALFRSFISPAPSLPSSLP